MAEERAFGLPEHDRARESRWGANAYRGSWVRAVEPTDQWRARWIDEDESEADERPAERRHADGA